MVKKKGKALGSFTTKDPESDHPVRDTQDKEDQETILRHIASLHLNSDYSDLAIICKDETFSAHKLVVCPRSKYFQRACYGGFKETEGQIYLDERNPILIQKVLEFLYTGNYTLGCRTTTSNSDTNSDEGQRIDTEPERELGMDSLPDEYALHEAAAEIEDLTHETAEVALEKNADRAVHGSPMNEKPAPIDEGPEKGLIELGDAMEPIIDTLAEFHPSYFYVRMYSEADYFMISDLKTKAKVHFRASFMNFPDRDSFAKMIEELYSTRANYHELRKQAIEVIVDNLLDLRKGFAPVIDSEVVGSVPGFAIDLCLATMDNYVSEPPNMKPYPFATGVEYKGVDYKFYPMGTANLSN
ncbi:hypothetical protein F1880_008434 [Penicillium rolfsii]|nr:hypothetical protein F1880_008434 [Penicillium rolfsii]